METRLGAGGMGVVYKAEDTRLKRLVALRFLPEALSRDRRAVDRFQREAQAASAPNHLHICTVHDIDEHAGVGNLTRFPGVATTFGTYNGTHATCDGNAGRCMQFPLRYEF